MWYLLIKRAWCKRRSEASSTKPKHDWRVKLFVEKQEKVPSQSLTSFQKILTWRHSQKRRRRASVELSQKEHSSLDISPNLKRYLFVEIRQWSSLNWKICSLDSRVHRKSRLYDLLQSIISAPCAWKSDFHLLWFLYSRDACRSMSILKANLQKSLDPSSDSVFNIWEQSELCFTPKTAVTTLRYWRKLAFREYFSLKDSKVKTFDEVSSRRLLTF